MNNEARQSGPGLLHRSGAVIWAWVQGQILIVGSLGLIYCVGYALAGVPWWFLVASCSALLYLLPRIGSLLALLLALAVELLAGGDLWRLGAVVAVWVIAQTIEGYVLTPRIMGRRLGLSPWVVLFGTLAGGFAFGPLGLVFAVPVLAVGNVLVRSIRARSAAQTRISPSDPKVLR